MLRPVFLSFLYLRHRLSLPQIPRIHTDAIPSKLRISSADYINL